MARPRSDVNQRFKSKAVEVESGCIEWISTIKKDGYGSFHYEGRQEQAHRVAYKLQVGPIPEGACVLHKCDNRKCVNVSHLFLGSIQDNIKDMDKKKRRGSKSKLTEKQAAEVRRLLKAKHSQQSIADLFGVGQTVISRIKLGTTKLFKSN